MLTTLMIYDYQDDDDESKRLRGGFGGQDDQSVWLAWAGLGGC